MNKQRLRRLMAPKSIAVFGSRGADFAIRESQKLGFTGTIYAVHPNRDELAGLPCLASVEHLPHAPDAAYVAVNASAAIDIVAQLNAMGAGGAVLYASGFAEVGEAGLERQHKLVAAAGDMPIIGPNCYGVLNALDKAVLWPDQHGLEAVDQGVGIITQSGNIGLNITMQQTGLPVAYIVTMGNQAQADIATIMDAMLDDPRVTAIGLHIESIGDLMAFDKAARRALEMRIPIIALKSGRTEAAAKIALSHTSSLTGADQLFDALFQRLGIVRINTLPQFLETLKLLTLLGPIATPNVASMSCSGGEAGMMADLIAATDLTFGELSVQQAQAVTQHLHTHSNNDYVNASNPLDYHTFIWGQREAMAATFGAMMDAHYSATMLLLDWPNYPDADPTEWDTALLALADATKGTHKGIILASIAECLPQHAIRMCREHGLTPMIGLDTCLQALHHAYQVSCAFSRPTPAPLCQAHPNLTTPTTTYNEFTAKQRIQDHGIAIPKGGIANSVMQAQDLARMIGFPVTIKAVADDLLHKTEVDAVRLNINSAADVANACAHLSTLSNQLLVEAMVTDVVTEMIVGVNNDPAFGNYLVVGAGGILVELLKDSQIVLLPCTREDIATAINKLTIAPLLAGFRGKPAANVDTLIDTIIAIADMVIATPVREMDINPLLVGSNGTIAVDALIRA